MSYHSDLCREKDLEQETASRLVLMETKACVAAEDMRATRVAQTMTEAAGLKRPRPAALSRSRLQAIHLHRRHHPRRRSMWNRTRLSAPTNRRKDSFKFSVFSFQLRAFLF